ncbi:MAG: hypothetical protein KDK70_34170 [Myxococcales bacterium]|nr:hypothetical protein [Myxococcales bacterium]
MTPSLQIPLVRSIPRISANKLGEYLVSPPIRRRAIIERHKYPNAYAAGYYGPARDTLVDYLAGHISRAKVLERIEALVSAEHETTYQRHQAHGCAEAVLRFLDLEPALDLQGMTPIHLLRHDPLEISGVTVSVRPDLVLEGQDPRGRPTLGAIKLHFPKTHPQTEASAAYVATLLRMHAAQTMSDRGKVHQDACLVIDVFARQVVTAPRGYKRRWRDIEAACDEIRRAWPEA